MSERVCEKCGNTQEELKHIDIDDRNFNMCFGRCTYPDDTPSEDFTCGFGDTCTAPVEIKGRRCAAHEYAADTPAPVLSSEDVPRRGRAVYGCPRCNALQRELERAEAQVVALGGTLSPAEDLEAFDG